MIKWGKIWGETWSVFANNRTSVHVLRIRKRGYCSVHKHERKINHFVVISGELEIRIWPSAEPNLSRDEPDSTILSAGQETSIPIGMYHQFRARTDNVVALEIYEIIAGDPDIFRLNHGGRI